MKCVVLLGNHVFFFKEYHRIATRFLRNKLARHLPIDSPERVDGPRYLVCYTTPRNGSCTLLCRRLDGSSRCPNPGSGALGRASDPRWWWGPGLPPDTWKWWYERP